MIKRIVRMEFAEGGSAAFFKDILPHQKQFTRSFKGCQHLELWQDTADGAVMSFSIWDSEQDLNAYRNSEKFRAFWAKTKVLFATPAGAWSVKVVEVVDKL